MTFFLNDTSCIYLNILAEVDLARGIAPAVGLGYRMLKLLNNNNFSLSGKAESLRVWLSQWWPSNLQLQAHSSTSTPPLHAISATASDPDRTALVTSTELKSVRGSGQFQ